MILEDIHCSSHVSVVIHLSAVNCFPAYDFCAQLHNKNSILLISLSSYFIIKQISNMDVVLDTLIEALRLRMGLILSRIDQLPAYGPLIAAMDAEAVTWARSAVITTSAGTFSSAAATMRAGLLESGGLLKIGGAASALDYDSAAFGTAAAEGEGESDLIALCRSLNINMASTRHLVICVQSNLLNVPANLRRAPANAQDEVPALSDGYGSSAAAASSSSSAATTWFQRKTRCDALLALCKYFAQQFSVKH